MDLVQNLAGSMLYSLQLIHAAEDGVINGLIYKRSPAQPIFSLAVPIQGSRHLRPATSKWGLVEVALRWCGGDQN